MLYIFLGTTLYKKSSTIVCMYNFFSKGTMLYVLCNVVHIFGYKLYISSTNCTSLSIFTSTTLQQTYNYQRVVDFEYKLQFAINFYQKVQIVHRNSYVRIEMTVPRAGWSFLCQNRLTLTRRDTPGSFRQGLKIHRITFYLWRAAPCYY